MLRVLYLMFVLSGAAGLVYESIWTRYLGLFVGHDAYAQIIVLVIFLGGMSAGALVVSRFSERIRQPLLWYAAIELTVGIIGFLFHDGFQSATAWAYRSVYPSLAGSWALPLAKWSIAGALLLPQSVLLGATFPLMSAGALRLDASQPGRTLSLLYFANSLGAAAGVLVAGFYLLALVGLPGTLAVAAALNVAVAVGTAAVAIRVRRSDTRPLAAASAPPTSAPVPAELASSTLRRLLLLTSFGTAVASFIYEIDWLRMLALVLGSATHSFELMLSAFILGLALGALWVRSRADQFQNPIVVLGIVQWTMGLLALATLMLYTASFEWVGTLMDAFAQTSAGYAGFTVAKYGLCLAIMLPATFCAGMTLPLITRILMTSGFGERAIGAVYSWNTLGSIVGVIVGGLVLMPLLGLKGMLIVGALLDMGIGVLLLSRQPRLAWTAGVATAAVVIAGITTPSLDPVVLTSGVFRSGVSRPDDREIRFYTDGRTATVTGYVDAGLLVLSTNGKPDASLTPVWFKSCDPTAERQPLVDDAATQTLLPLITLAHAPHAQSAAIIGQGSGMSSHFLLGSPNLEELVTIEIEPQMIEGSRNVFYPANRRAFDDPRSKFVIDDAKSYFASAHRRFDLIMSEPSNPWVSGVSGLFTSEFYARVRQYLAEDGVFGQWLHVYELNDDLVLSVLAAIHQNFPSYEIYLVPKGDLLVVASNRPALPAPDWSVVDFPSIRADLCHFVPPTPAAMDALHLIGRRALTPLLDNYEHANSDFFPVLDLGAERSRFVDDYASGFSALSADWFNLLSSRVGQPADFIGTPLPPFPENPRLRARALATHLRPASDTSAVGGTLSGAAQRAEYEWQTWQARLTTARPPSSWEMWVDQAGAVQRLRSGGAAGRTDDELYAATIGFLERHVAPNAVRDVVEFRYAIASWDFAKAAQSADRLASLVQEEPQWIDLDELRDGAVFAKLAIGDVAGARRMLDELADLGDRGSGDLRNRLLEAYVSEADQHEALSRGP